MNDKDDIMVKDLIEYCNLNETQAINVMYQIRGNAIRYFSVFNKEIE